MSRSHADVLIVGCGPAGAAAAITAAAAGLDVRLLERSAFPRHRPGETLHPGVEPVLARLGVADRVAAVSGARHAAQSVSWAGRATVTSFGGSAEEPWRGYQVAREDLDAILVERACELGVDLRRPEAAGAPVIEAGRLTGTEQHRARIVIDATGGLGWLRRGLRLPFVAASPPLRADYGYCAGDGDPIPALRGDGTGWTWTAQVAPGRVHWTRLTFPGVARSSGPPPSLADLPPLGRIRGADVSWRHVPASAGASWFLAGDAACVLDPAASHGVLRALISGIAAARLATKVLGGLLSASEAASAFRAWVAAWFASDAARLAALYRQLEPGEGVTWPAR